MALAYSNGFTLGAPSDFKEDVFTVENNNAFNPLTSGEDKVASPSYPQEAVIGCPNKDVRIAAPMSEPFKLSASSEWEDMFGGGIASVATGIIGTVNNALQWSKGVTLQQPWMNRKMYKNTKPFSFTLPLTFITPPGESPSEWVARPCMALMSLLYPRDLKNTNSEVSLSKLVEDKFGYNTRGTHSDSLLGSFINLFDCYAIPGPSLRSKMENAGSDDKGDYVYVMVGSIFNFGMCYVDSVDFNFSTAYDPSGYPLAAKANVKLTCQDSIYCESNGNFNVTKINNNADNLSKFLDASTLTVQHLVSNLSDVKNAVTGFYSGEGV